MSESPTGVQCGDPVPPRSSRASVAPFLAGAYPDPEAIDQLVRELATAIGSTQAIKRGGDADHLRERLRRALEGIVTMIAPVIHYGSTRGELKIALESERQRHHRTHQALKRALEHLAGAPPPAKGSSPAPTPCG